MHFPSRARRSAYHLLEGSGSRGSGAEEEENVRRLGLGVATLRPGTGEEEACISWHVPMPRGGGRRERAGADGSTRASSFKRGLGGIMAE